MNLNTPIYEPKDSNFRPYNISTLIAFVVGRGLGRLFKRLFGR